MSRLKVRKRGDVGGALLDAWRWEGDGETLQEIADCIGREVVVAADEKGVLYADVGVGEPLPLLVGTVIVVRDGLPELWLPNLFWAEYEVEIVPRRVRTDGCPSVGDLDVPGGTLQQLRVSRQAKEVMGDAGHADG